MIASGTADVEAVLMERCRASNTAGCSARKLTCSAGASKAAGTSPVCHRIPATRQRPRAAHILHAWGTKHSQQPDVSCTDVQKIGEAGRQRV